MAIPLLPAVGLGYGVLRKLFNKRPEFQTPEFFGPDFNNQEAAIRQAHQAQYGGGLNDIREALANSGMLNPAALTDAGTKFEIAKSADVAGAESDAYAQELALKRNADLMKKQYEYGADVEARGQQLNLLTSGATALGSIYASKHAGNTSEPASKYIDINDNPFFKDPNHKSTVMRVLKSLFGI